jgi:hypothetical protein
MVELILGNMLVVALHGFPGSIGEAWALADPTMAKKRLKAESSVGNEAQASGDSWATLLQRLPHWVRRP